MTVSGSAWVMPSTGRVEEGLRVRVLGTLKDLVHRSLLHDPAGVHHRDVIGHLGDHAQVMRDQEDGGVVAFLEIFHQGQDLRLDGDVEAVVGSSAIRSTGSQAIAIAIIARWRMPPESWCG